MMLYRINANVKSIIVVNPVMLYTTSMNNTAAVAMPFGAVKAIIIRSVVLYFSSLKLSHVAKNLMIVYMINSAIEVIMNFFVRGILMIIPVSMKTRMYNAFVNTLSMPSSVGFSLMYALPKNKPSAVTANTPDPPRFSAST